MIGDTGKFEFTRDTQGQILTPGRRNDLNSDGEAIGPYRDRHDRKADEADRLRVETEIGAGVHRPTFKHDHGLVASRRRAGRGRRQQHVPSRKQLRASA